MEGSFWMTLLGLVAAAASETTLPPHKPLTHEKAVEFGVDLFNEKGGEESLYRLLQAPPQPGWDPTANGLQELNFTIQETVCLAEDQGDVAECDFKENGVVRECTGYYSFEEKPPIAVEVCEIMGGEEEEEEEKEEEKEEEQEQHRPKRVKRFKKFFRKLKEGVKQFFRKHRIVIGARIRF